MSETWTKQATHVDPGVDAWRIDAGAIQVAIVFSEADADAILRHKAALESIVCDHYAPFPGCKGCVAVEALKGGAV